jgi:hypothetical protein
MLTIKNLKGSDQKEETVGFTSFDLTGTPPVFRMLLQNNA